jgi:hypothetical protein
MGVTQGLMGRAEPKAIGVTAHAPSPPTATMTQNRSWHGVDRTSCLTWVLGLPFFQSGSEQVAVANRTAMAVERCGLWPDFS